MVKMLVKKIYRSTLKMKIFNKHFDGITTRTGAKYMPHTKRFEFYLIGRAQTLEKRIKNMSGKYDPKEIYWATAERAGEVEDMLMELNNTSVLKVNSSKFLIIERNKMFYKTILNVLNNCAEWLKERLPNEGR